MSSEEMAALSYLRENIRWQHASQQNMMASLHRYHTRHADDTSIRRYYYHSSSLPMAVVEKRVVMARSYARYVRGAR